MLNDGYQFYYYDSYDNKKNPFTQQDYILNYLFVGNFTNLSATSFNLTVLPFESLPLAENNVTALRDALSSDFIDYHYFSYKYNWCGLPIERTYFYNRSLCAQGEGDCGMLFPDSLLMQTAKIYYKGMED